MKTFMKKALIAIALVMISLITACTESNGGTANSLLDESRSSTVAAPAIKTVKFDDRVDTGAFDKEHARIVRNIESEAIDLIEQIDLSSSPSITNQHISLAPRIRRCKQYLGFNFCRYDLQIQVAWKSSHVPYSSVVYAHFLFIAIDETRTEFLLAKNNGTDPISDSDYDASDTQELNRLGANKWGLEGSRFRTIIESAVSIIQMRGKTSSL